MSWNWRHQLVALVLVSAVTIVRLVLGYYDLGGQTRFLLFALAVVVAAWFGGLLAGMSATLLSTLAVIYFLIEPVWDLRIHDIRDTIPMGIFIIEGALISWISQTRLNVLERLQAAHDQLEERVRLRTSELVQANDQLLAEAEHREHATEELRALTEKLQVSNRELESFASVASHDLQEPLRKIQAFGDRLATRCSAGLGEDGRDYLNRMKNAAERMQRLINDLLAFSRITTKAQPFQTVDLNEAVQLVLADLETRIEQSGGRVETQPLPVIDADPVQIRQLFQNLLSNAFKFARPGFPPTVRVYEQRATNGSPAAAEESSMVELHVSDTGIGFDEKYLDRIFNVFQRLHGRGVYEGTGIGLAVCRRIVERHGGSITATSRPNEGSTFVVRLPRRHNIDGKELHVTAADADHHPAGR